MHARPLLVLFSQEISFNVQTYFVQVSFLAHLFIIQFFFFIILRKIKPIIGKSYFEMKKNWILAKYKTVYELLSYGHSEKKCVIYEEYVKFNQIWDQYQVKVCVHLVNAFDSVYFYNLICICYYYYYTSPGTCNGIQQIYLIHETYFWLLRYCSTNKLS